jgi:hypothetical protein
MQATAESTLMRAIQLARSFNEWLDAAPVIRREHHVRALSFMHPLNLYYHPQS